MPNRYEREIEEILRNLESTEPKPGLGQKFGERFRRRPEYRVKPRRRSFPSFNFRTTDWLLIIAIGAALISGGYAYANGEATIVTGLLAIVGIVSLFLVVLLPFLSRPRRASQFSRYGNVTPIGRNPFRRIATRWNLFLLKMRYRRRKNH